MTGKELQHASHEAIPFTSLCRSINASLSNDFKRLDGAPGKTRTCGFLIRSRLIRLDKPFI
jgi:hypothetical protein